MRLFINLVVKDDRQVVADTGPMPAGIGSGCHNRPSASH